MYMVSLALPLENGGGEGSILKQQVERHMHSNETLPLLLLLLLLLPLDMPLDAPLDARCGYALRTYLVKSTINLSPTIFNTL